MLQLVNAIFIMECATFSYVPRENETAASLKKDQRPNRTEAESDTADYSTRENVSCLKHRILLSSQHEIKPAWDCKTPSYSQGYQFH